MAKEKTELTNIHIDTSAMGGNDSRTSHEVLIKKKYSANFVYEQLRGHPLLHISPEVLKEYNWGIWRLRDYYLRSPKADRDAFIQAIAAEERLYSLVSDEPAKRYERLMPKLKGLIALMQPAVDKIFQEYGGKTNRLQTDTKVLSAVIAHLHYEDASLLSNDAAMIKTFKYFARKILRHRSSIILLRPGTFLESQVIGNYATATLPAV